MKTRALRVYLSVPWVPSRLVAETFGERPVGVDAPIAQERPVRAAEFDLCQVAIDDHHGFLVDRGALHDLSVRRGDERLAPEHDAVLVDGLSPGVLDDLVADAVRHADVAAVGNGVAALDRLPRVVLRIAVLLALRGMPADRGGVEQDFGAL